MTLYHWYIIRYKSNKKKRDKRKSASNIYIFYRCLVKFMRNKVLFHERESAHLHDKNNKGLQRNNKVLTGN